MNVLMLSLDRKAFENGSAVRARLARYGAVFSELHIIVYTKRTDGLEETQIAPNVWLRPTQSRTRLGYIPDAIRIGRAIYAQSRFDVISAQDACETGIPAARLAHRFSLPLLLQDHADVFNPAYIAESFGNRVRASISRHMFPKAALVRTVASGSETRLLSLLPALAGRTYRLPVYTDMGTPRTNTAGLSLRKKYPQFSRILLSACRFVPQKNLILALETLACVRESESGIGLVLVGEGPLRDALEQKSRALGLADAVAFEPWQTDLASFYNEAHVFLMTSSYESYGRTLIEAAACGLPFVSTDVGIARELARDGVGYVSDSPEPEHLASLVQEALQAPILASEQGIRAVESLQSASLDEYLERYLDMMEQCVLAMNAHTRP